MNYRRPELMNTLAAEYVLGTLKGGARRRFEGLLLNDHELRALVETWMGRLCPVGLPSEHLGPSRHAWSELELRLAQARSKVAQNPSILPLPCMPRG